MPSFHAAIDRLYQVFAAYPRPEHVAGCTHCIDEEDHAHLFAAPLRELTEEHLARFAFQSLTTWGEVDDFRHFLPRLLELVAMGKLWVDPEVVFGKLRLGEWNTWPADEQAAVRDYLRALWRETVLSDGSPDTDSLLCAIAQAEDDLSPYLESWVEVLTPAAQAGIADFLEWNMESLQRDGTLSNAFWSEHEAQVEQVVRWLRSSRVAARITAALRNEPPLEALGAAFASWAGAREMKGALR